MTFAENKNDTFVKDVIKRDLTTPSLFLKGVLPELNRNEIARDVEASNSIHLCKKYGSFLVPP